MGRCVVCGGEARKSSDYDNGALLEADESCGACGYSFDYAYGNGRETIGRWYYESSYTDPDDLCRKRQNARTVALVARRHELGLIPDAQKGFAAALAADPSDFTTAKVYADWLDEHGPDDQTTKWAAHRLRDYDDPVGFPPLDGVINRAAEAIKLLTGVADVWRA